MQVVSEAAEIPARSMVDRPKTIRGKTVLVTLDHLDGRSMAARRANELAEAFTAALSNNVTATQR